ncbi:ATP-binding protein [Halioglobus maricola]|uniref:ATP-binding protein n=1 Tax=Halioglobus maricola TaxID=2601894 RepID=A0A5P9NNW3_9GAMM|nr:YifB family Mg chelatase-like AAA ATPase [Halioglobus maricola]QFU77135.1 ATP-binding protein [Halioglobus maricola]
MELSIIHSRALAGLSAPPVQVETHLSNGLPAFHIVGMPETAVRESKDRVRSAILNSHFDFPDRRITVNLAPADLPKGGGRFDLPIALGILVASGQVPRDRLENHEFLGELALNGGLRAVSGVICAALAASASGKQLVAPEQCAGTAAAVPEVRLIGPPDLLTLCAHLNGSVPLHPVKIPAVTASGETGSDLAEVVGQDAARRALEVAASGGHNLLLAGPPGTGKTLLASRLPGILPPPDHDESLVILALRDFGGVARPGEALVRPFRAPHHSASAGALIGGGSPPLPGEASLAHGGVLFLDELPEFSRHCLETLREPMESGHVTLSRARHKASYPASFQLIAAMNPCPCGYLGDPERACRCSADQIQRYTARVSGPLLDRIDLHVQVSRVAPAQLLQREHDGEDSATVRRRVSRCRARQLERQHCVNARLHSDRLLDICTLGRGERKILEQAAQRLKLSGRAIHRTLRVALTLADMAEVDHIHELHLAEALGYRAS